MIDLSYSRLQSFERCPWLYHLVFDEGWRSGPSAPAALGQSLHRTLAAYLSPENKNRTEQRLLELADQYWVNEGFASAQDAIDAYGRGRSMLQRFFEADASRSTEVVGTEVEFITPLSDSIQFRGTVDRLDRHSDGTYEVVEYKTQAETWPAARVENDLQMTLYAFGVRNALQSGPVRLRYVFLSTGESVEARRTDDQIETARRRLLAAGERLSAGDRSPQWTSCPRCEFLGRCSKADPNAKKEGKK